MGYRGAQDHPCADCRADGGAGRRHPRPKDHSRATDHRRPKRGQSTVVGRGRFAGGGYGLPTPAVLVLDATRGPA